MRIVRIRSDFVNNTWRKKLLVVDDDKLVCMLHQLFFLDKFDVTVANNGAEALDCLEKQSFDLVLTDIQMPVLDGFGLASAIRGLNSANQGIGIIGVTSMEISSIESKAKAAGIDYLFRKPVELSQVSQFCWRLVAPKRSSIAC